MKRIVLALVTLSIVAALTIGLNGDCSFGGLWNIPAA
jgi:hypothetical protein